MGSKQWFARGIDQDIKRQLMKRSVRAHDHSLVSGELGHAVEQQLAKALRFCLDAVPIPDGLYQRVSALLNCQPSGQLADSGAAARHNNAVRSRITERELEQDFIWPQGSLYLLQRERLPLNAACPAEQFSLGGRKLFLGNKDLIQQPPSLDSIRRAKQLQLQIGNAPLAGSEFWGLLNIGNAA
jgi:hypothetical protein